MRITAISRSCVSFWSALTCWIWSTRPRRRITRTTVAPRWRRARLASPRSRLWPTPSGRRRRRLSASASLSRSVSRRTVSAHGSSRYVILVSFYFVPCYWQLIFVDKDYRDNARYLFILSPLTLHTWHNSLLLSVTAWTRTWRPSTRTSRLWKPNWSRCRSASRLSSASKKKKLQILFLLFLASDALASQSHTNYASRFYLTCHSNGCHFFCSQFLFMNYPFTHPLVDTTIFFPLLNKLCLIPGGDDRTNNLRLPLKITITITSSR